MIWSTRSQTIAFPRTPLVMGIVNLNNDSFCGDGTLDPRLALNQAAQQLQWGADIIDIGAESARTNRPPITEQEEIDRLTPFLEQWHELVRQFMVSRPGATAPLLSINTWRSGVLRAVLPLGGDLVNDISALPDADNAAIAADHGASLLIMHSIGLPKVSHTHVGYTDVMEELKRFFASRIQLATQAGLREEQLVLDPGIDFAKQRDDNLRIYRELELLGEFGRPILLPVSRKTVIGDVLELPDPTDRDAGTVACIAAGMRRGGHLFRVHHVRAASQAVRMLAPLCPGTV